MNIKESLQEHLDYHMAASNQHDLVVMIYQISENNEVCVDFFNNSLKDALYGLAGRKNQEIRIYADGEEEKPVAIKSLEKTDAAEASTGRGKFYTYAEAFEKLVAIGCKNSGIIVGDAGVRDFLQSPEKTIPAEVRAEVIAAVKSQVKFNAYSLGLSYKYLARANESQERG